jgi:hypothetical protein
MGMRRRFATLVLLLAVTGALAGFARAEVIQSGDVRVNFNADFTPISLPRERPAPITIDVGGKISTTDGTHPPAMRRMRIELNSAGKIETAGLPACPPSLLQSTSSTAALGRCAPARVGEGTFEAQLQSTGKPIPVEGRALVFNGPVDGRAGMLIHIYISRPVRVTLVVPLRISHRSGEFGTVLTTKVPLLAGGIGSITELQLRIGRQYTSGGVHRSYLSAACAAPSGFPGIVFAFARATFKFEGGRTLHTGLTRECKVRKPAGSG